MTNGKIGVKDGLYVDAGVVARVDASTLAKEKSVAFGDARIDCELARPLQPEDEAGDDIESRGEEAPDIGGDGPAGSILFMLGA